MPQSNWSGSGGGGGAVLNKTATEMYTYVGTEGEIIYNTTYMNHFVYRTNWWHPLGTPDPRYGFYLQDEFTTSITTAEQGWLNVANTVTTATQTSPGVFLGRCGSASTRALLAAGTNSLMSGTMDIYVEWIARFPVLATALEDYSAFLGMTDAGAYVSGSLGTDYAGLCYNRGINGANLIQYTGNAGVGTPTNTTTPVVADTPYCFGLLIKGSATAEFFLNRVSTGVAHVATLPTNRGAQFQARLDKIAGSGNSDIVVDAFTAWGFFNGKAES